VTKKEFLHYESKKVKGLSCKLSKEKIEEIKINYWALKWIWLKHKRPEVIKSSSKNLEDY